MSQFESKSMLNQQNDDAAVNVDVDVDVERQAENNTDVLSYAGRKLSFEEEFSNTWIRFSGKATTLRAQALELLFGLSVDHASKWPGSLVFCQHLESCFKELLGPQFDILWKILQRHSPVSTVDCWHWCFAVINTFQAPQDDDASIEKAYQRLMEKAKKPLHEIEIHEKTQIMRAMFAVLCWTSATLKPPLNDETNTTDEAIPVMVQNVSSLVAENSSRKHSTKDLRRPISKMFYSFQNHAEGIEDSEHHPANGGTLSSGNSSNDVLYESSLNYFTLFTIGRVRLKWVDTLTAHLAFDRSTRTLSVFRFPSFCATNVLRGNDVKVLKNITAKLLPSHYYADSLQEPSDMHREVLLSYRLLFGQSSRARKILNQLLNQPSSSPAAVITTHCNRSTTNQYHSSPPSRDTIDNIDPFLATICTSPLYSRWSRLSFIRRERPSPLIPSNVFPSSALDLNDQLQESDTYSARDDFAVFGPRLLTLQRYIMKQQPSKVKDLWRDRRNPLQWYTFWAVLWVGGASIMLGMLQLLVGAAQLYLAIRPLS